MKPNHASLVLTPPTKIYPFFPGLACHPCRLFHFRSFLKIRKRITFMRWTHLLLALAFLVSLLALTSCTENRNDVLEDEEKALLKQVREDPDNSELLATLGTLQYRQQQFM